MRGLWRPVLTFTLVFSPILVWGGWSETEDAGWTAAFFLIGPVGGMFLGLLNAGRARGTARVVAREAGGHVGRATVNFVAKAVVPVESGRHKWRVEAWEYVDDFFRTEIVRPDGLRVEEDAQVTQVVRGWRDERADEDPFSLA